MNAHEPARDWSIDCAIRSEKPTDVTRAFVIVGYLVACPVPEQMCRADHPPVFYRTERFPLHDPGINYIFAHIPS